MYNRRGLARNRLSASASKCRRQACSSLDDPFLNMIVDLYPTYTQLREKGKERDGRLDQLYGDLAGGEKEFLSASFVPDANATLRSRTATSAAILPKMQ